MTQQAKHVPCEDGCGTIVQVGAWYEGEVVCGPCRQKRLKG